MLFPLSSISVSIGEIKEVNGSEIGASKFNPSGLGVNFCSCFVDFDDVK